MFLNNTCPVCGCGLSQENCADIISPVTNGDSQTGECWSCGAFIRLTVEMMTVHLKVELEPEHDDSGY